MSAVENEGGRGSARALAFASSLGRFLVIAITTYLGLLAVTFFIGRVVPIDPVLAIVGDRAPGKWSSARGWNWVWTSRSTAVLALSWPDRAWRPRHLGADLHPVTQDIARFCRRRSNWRRGHHHRRRHRRAARRLAAVKQGKLVDQAVRAVRPRRLFAADLLARPAVRCCCSTPRWAGRPGRAAEHLFRRIWFTSITGILTIDSLIAGDWGAFWDAGAISSSRPAAGLLLLAYISRMTRSSC
jgi:peptide/nickel transport system permease protein